MIFFAKGIYKNCLSWYNNYQCVTFGNQTTFFAFQEEIMKYYLGIDIGGMSIKCGLAGADGNVVFQKAIVTNPWQDYQITVKEMADLCADVVKSAGATMADVVACGMGIPGTIDAERGVITYSNNINFHNVPIVEEFRKHLDIPTFIGNDANLATLGEMMFGSAKGSKDIIFVTLGTGVGTGIIVDGKMIIGKGGAGAEGGHITLKFGGEPCSCGRRGCWEAYASATALIRQTKRAIEKNPESLLKAVAEEQGSVSGKTAFEAASRGDGIARNVINMYVKYVAEGLISLINIFRPECIVIGGGISNTGDAFFEALQKRVDHYSYGGTTCPKVSVRRAALKNDAGILGGVALALSETN